MKPVIPTFALLICLAAVPTAAYAEDDDAEITRMAKERYKAGLDAYKAGKYDVAIKELKKAYLLKRLPALLLNIGATYRKLGDLNLSLHFYKKYLDEAPADARDRSDVEKIIAEVKTEKEGGGPDKQEEAQAAPPKREEAPPSKPDKPARQWSHQVIDAAPPDTPMDVRVSMPVMKGVKVNVYYRVAGEADYKPVLMKRKGVEKVGRIPAGAMQGKSIQYYVEARDPAGTVVNSSGSQSSPNIVMIDPNAQPQLASSGEEAPEPGQVDEPRTGSRDLDDETPMSRRERLTKRTQKALRGPAGRFGPLFWAGVGAMSLGAAVTGGLGVTGLLLAQQRSNEIAAFSADPRDADGNRIFFNEDPIARDSGLKQMAAIEQEGKMWNAVGIAFTVVGPAFLVAGGVLMLVDQLPKLRQHEQPRKPRRPRVHDEQARAAPGDRDAVESQGGAKPLKWYVAPSVSPTFAGAGGGFSF